MHWLEQTDETTMLDRLLSMLGPSLGLVVKPDGEVVEVIELEGRGDA